MKININEYMVAYINKINNLRYVCSCLNCQNPYYQKASESKEGIRAFVVAISKYTLKHLPEEGKIELHSRCYGLTSPKNSIDEMFDIVVCLRNNLPQWRSEIDKAMTEEFLLPVLGQIDLIDDFNEVLYLFYQLGPEWLWGAKNPDEVEEYNDRSMRTLSRSLKHALIDILQKHFDIKR